MLPSTTSNGNVSTRSIGKPSASYPGSIATDQHLAIAVDQQQTRLAVPMGATDTQMTVTDSGQIVQWSLLSIEKEIVQVSGAPTGPTVPVTRGFDGTTSALHLAGVIVAGLVDAYHHNTLVSEVQAIETALGPNLSAIPSSSLYPTPKYNFTAIPATGNLAVGANVLNLASVPAGLAVNNRLWVSGGAGAAEAALITGLSGNQLIINCANAHTGAWTLTSASFGLQEAVVAAGTAGGGTVYVPPGNYTLNATVNVNNSNVIIQGSGINGTLITRTGDFGDSIYAKSVNTIHVSGLYLEQLINYAAGPPPTISNRPTSGAHIRFQNCANSSVHDNTCLNMPYGIELDTVGWMDCYRNFVKSVWDYAFPAVQVSVASIYLHHSMTGAGYPTYTWVRQNVITGYGSAPRTITVNGNAITSHTEPTGSKYGILVESAEVVWITDNSIEWCNDSGIAIIAAAAHGVSDALLAISISGNYIDYHRLAGIKFDTTANTGMYALGTKIDNNLILGSSGTVNGIYIAGAAVATDFIRTAHETTITNNTIRSPLGSGIYMLAGGLTLISNNLIDDYNKLNSFPTNSLNTGVNPPTGDRTGNSAIYAALAANAFSITRNRLGGNALGGAYDGTSTFTVNAVTTANLLFTGGQGAVVTAPNDDSGVQPPGSRNPPVPYDPGLFAPVLEPSNNFIVETGSNNAIAGSITGIGLTPGLTITVRLGHTLQAGANTFALNFGPPVPIKSSKNQANNIATAYAVGGIVTLAYDGTGAVWLDLSQ